jgi:uncharacterized protein YuzE
MEINVDSKNDIMRIKFSNEKYHISKEVDDGIMIDISKNKKIVAIEILDVSEKISKKSLKNIGLKASS